MGRPKVNAVHGYFVYDRIARTSNCSICKIDVKGNHVTNLLSHLSKYHGNKYTTVMMKNEQYKRESSQDTSSCFDDPSDASPRKCVREERVVHECVDLVTVHGRPFALMDDIAFKNIIKMIPPGSGTNKIIIVNAVKIKKAVTERTRSIRDIIAKEVESKLVSLKVDCAYTCMDRSFLDVNLQYIYNKKIVLKTLAVVEMTERHTAEALKLEILSILNMYGISIHQLYTITTDNASNMQKMIKLLGSQQFVDIIQEEDVTEHSDEDDADAHMITWNESDDFSDIVLSEPYEFSADAEGSSDTEMNVRNYAGHPVVISSPDCALGETIENARKLVKKLQTPTLKGMLKAMKRRKPIIDCVTRWNSTVDMLERLLEPRDICEANEELHMPQVAWTKIKSIVQTLTPCRIATKNLQREHFGALGKQKIDDARTV
ncbi:uncharacterized protein [Mycetomoellerius zeteki]|uniref:uncharacterized protein n=1 Tax=Mycetomoellerius zeteki TaxID=64791 RepID=UPI00084E3AFE|nr:PREDICTED: uncharacterized protein LOC108724101 [Trachymyrmex zeteki]